MKKIQKLLFLIIICFPCLFVNADEEVCTTYRNYYFFNEINDFSVVENKVAENSGVWQRRNVTYFPNIHGVTDEKGVEHRKVCLGTETGCFETWTLEEFYNNYKEVMTKGQKGTIKIDGIEKNEEYRVYTFTNEEDKEVSYILHSAWFETDENGEALTTSRSENVNYSSVDTDALVKGTFIPTESDPTFNFTAKTNEAGYVKAKIDRRIETADYANVTPFSLAWSSTGSSIQSVLTPALYYSEYELCGKESEPVYEAVINYYKKGTTEKVANSWTNSNLSDGYRETVKSPVVKNDNEICEPDHDSVDVLIEGKKFEKNVYYSCTGPTQTGSAYIWVVLFIAVASLGVGMWYYRKNNV